MLAVYFKRYDTVHFRFTVPQVDGVSVRGVDLGGSVRVWSRKMTDEEVEFLYGDHATLGVELFMEFLAEYGVSLNDFMKTWDGVPHEH